MVCYSKAIVNLKSSSGNLLFGGQIVLNFSGFQVRVLPGSNDDG